MQFLIINASPNPAGITAKFCTSFTDAAKKVGEVRQLNLHDAAPPMSKGVYPSLKPETLSIYQQAILECDGLFIATPTYWFNIPSILKALIENLDEIESELFKRPRAVGMVVHAPEGGEFGAAAPTLLALNHLNFAIVENGYVYYRGIPKDDWAWHDIAAMPLEMKRVVGK